MKYQLLIIVDIEFTLSNDEFAFVTNAIASHSDTKYAVTVGNFWYGNKGRRDFSEDENPGEDCYLSVTIREMGKIIKSLEPYITYTLPNPIEQKFGADLYFNLSTILKEACEKSRELNNAAPIKEITS